MRSHLWVAAMVMAILAGLAWGKSQATWKSQFEKLVTGMTRVEAEKEIERVRKTKSTYELYAMDIAPLVAYKLDQETVLLVTYKPGTPGADVVGGNGGHPPQDGTLVGYEILRVR